MNAKIQLYLIALVGCLTCLSVRAQDPNVEIIEKLYSKISQVVGIGNPDVAAGSEYLVLANPGVLVDPKISVDSDSTTDPHKLADGRYKLSRVLDKVLVPDFRYKTLNERTVDIYQTILNFKETPIYKLPDEAKQQLDAARKLVFVDGDRKKGYTAEFKDFQSKRTAFATANDNVTQYKDDHPDRAVPEFLWDALDKATNDYNFLGQRNAFVAAISVIDQWEHLDPNVWWGALSTQFTRNTDVRNGQPVALYDLYPSYSNWTDTSKEWWHEGFSESDLTQITHNSQSSVSGGFDAGWGLWSVGADYNHQESRTYFENNVSGYTVSFDLLRVDIDRPWMNSMVFKSRAWQWLASSPLVNRQISDGGDALHGIAPKGEMPFLPTALLLARNVKVSGSWSHDLKTSFDQHTSGGASIGWGPFSFGGRFDNADQSTYVRGQAAGNDINFKDAQIIGFFCEVLPKSPDRDPSLHFPSDNALGATSMLKLPFANAAIKKDDFRLDQAKQLIKARHEEKSQPR